MVDNCASKSNVPCARIHVREDRSAHQSTHTLFPFHHRHAQRCTALAKYGKNQSIVQSHWNMIGISIATDMTFTGNIYRQSICIVLVQTLEPFALIWNSSGHFPPRFRVSPRRPRRITNFRWKWERNLWFSCCWCMRTTWVIDWRTNQILSEPSYQK